jgi:hypothetical protein
MTRLHFLLAGLAFAASPDPFAAWNGTVKVRPLVPGAQRHSIHTYFNLSPESPDGRYVLFYTSTSEDGHHGEIRVRERATGKEILLADRPMVLNDALDVPDRVFSPYEVPEAADLPGPGTRFQEGDPVVTVFGEGETIEGCMGVLANRLACWRARLRRAAS